MFFFPSYKASRDGFVQRKSDTGKSKGYKIMFKTVEDPLSTLKSFGYSDFLAKVLSVLCSVKSIYKRPILSYPHLVGDIVYHNI